MRVLVAASLVLLVAALAPAAAEAAAVKVYFTKGEQLASVDRELPNGAGIVTATVQELLEGPTAAETRAGYGTAIPAGSALASAPIDAGRRLAILDFTGTFGSAKKLPDNDAAFREVYGARLAQVVYTVSALTGLDRVNVHVPGQVARTLSREDFEPDALHRARAAVDQDAGARRPARRADRARRARVPAAGGGHRHVRLPHDAGRARVPGVGGPAARRRRRPEDASATRRRRAPAPAHRARRAGTWRSTAQRGVVLLIDGAQARARNPHVDRDRRRRPGPRDAARDSGRSTARSCAPGRSRTRRGCRTRRTGTPAGRCTATPTCPRGRRRTAAPGCRCPRRRSSTTSSRSGRRSASSERAAGAPHRNRSSSGARISAVTPGPSPGVT